MSTDVAQFSAAEVRRRAGELITDELVLCGVRHHSPACALHVERLLERCHPSAVLVEGPPELDAVLGELTDERAQLPLAIYAYATRREGRGREALRSAGYYPMCDYSPELVALRWARAAGVPSRCIDLSFAAQAVIEAESESDVVLLDERPLAHSRTLQALRDRLGLRDEEELWEHLFEVDAADVAPEEHLARVAAYCMLARADTGLRDLERDGTAAREAAMAAELQRALSSRRPGDGPVFAVLGGFHAVAMPDLLREPPPSPVIDTRGVDVGTALIRYSFERLERRNGYSAGMSAPGWQQRLWTHRALPAGEARRQVALEAIEDIVEDVRRHSRIAVPTPALQAAYELALGLAELRGRRGPTRDDVTDAVLSATVKGDIAVDGPVVRAAIRRVMTGPDVGVPPPGTATPPLVADTHARLARLRLDLADGQRHVSALDLYRNPDHRALSRLLHGLALLGVPFALRDAGPDFVRGVGLTRLQEHWSYAWTPGVEAALVERSVLGDSLPEAVATRFEAVLEEFVDGPDRALSGRAAAYVAQACVIGAHEHVGAAVDACASALVADPDLVSAAGAARTLAGLWEGREPLEAKRIAALPDLIRAAYDRCLYLARRLPAEAGEPELDAFVALRELLASQAGTEFDGEPLWQVIRQQAEGHPAARIRGGLTGLRYTAGQLSAQELTRAVVGNLSGTVGAEAAVGYVVGLLRTAREAVWQDTGLLPALDALFASWSVQEFASFVPQLRLAFAQLTPRETDRVARQVAELLGGGPLELRPRRDISESELQAALRLSAVVAQGFERDGLADWAGA